MFSSRGEELHFRRRRICPVSGKLINAAFASVIDVWFLLCFISTITENVAILWDIPAHCSRVISVTASTSSGHTARTPGFALEDARQQGAV